MEQNSTASSLGKFNSTYIGILLPLVTMVLITTILLLSYIFLRACYGVPLLIASPGVVNDLAHLDHHSVEIGIDEETLNSFPKMSYSEKDSGSFISAEGNDLEEAEDKKDKNCCSICLSDYKESEVVRVIPDCGHMFHVDCIDEWLHLHPTCPVCRAFPLFSQRSSISLAPEAAATTILTVNDDDSFRPIPG